MKFQFKSLLLFVLLGGLSFAMNAQPYSSAIGLRVGYPLSVSYKKHKTEAKAYEIFGGMRPFTDYTELRLNGAIQIHKPISDSEYFRWYYGAGVGVAMYTFDNARPSDSGASLTGSFYLGVELTFADLPVNLSLDWVPTLYIGGFSRGFRTGYGALAFRYVLP